MNDELIYEILMELADEFAMTNEQEQILWERIVEKFESMRGIDYEEKYEWKHEG